MAWTLEYGNVISECHVLNKWKIAAQPTAILPVILANCLHSQTDLGG